MHALDAAVGEANIPGIIETVPTYRALYVSVDPLRAESESLSQRLIELAGSLHADPAGDAPVWEVPVCFDADFAEDLDPLAQASRQTRDDMIAALTQTDFPVFMLGFAPGYAFMGGLPEHLTFPRRREPRPRVAAGSLILANGQATIKTMDMPSGWHIVGRSPERCWRPDRSPPALILPGERIQLIAIERARYDALAADASAGKIVSRKRS